jgi:hypothetical protein
METWGGVSAPRDDSEAVEKLQLVEVTGGKRIVVVCEIRAKGKAHARRTFCDLEVWTEPLVTVLAAGV